MLKHRLKMMTLIPILVCSSGASAGPLIEVTPDVFSRVRAMAKVARLMYPGAPTDAAREFNDLFEQEFGEVMPNEAVLLLTDGVGVLLHTPISSLRDTFEYALLENAAFPESPARAAVLISVQPRRLMTPNIREVAVFRGRQRIEPFDSDFSQKTLLSSTGELRTVGAGTLAFPFATFASGAEVKIVLSTDVNQIEWRWSAERESALK
jgi:hypothetical protein